MNLFYKDTTHEMDIIEPTSTPTMAELVHKIEQLWPGRDITNVPVGVVGLLKILDLLGVITIAPPKQDKPAA